MASELQVVLQAIADGRSAGHRMALATIVKVQGSTYRREGARLLILKRGGSVGTISGGCLEDDVREAASEVIETGEPRLLRFDLTADDDAVWGWGLGCNGVIDVFVEPAAGAVEAAAAMRRAIEDRRSLVVVTVVTSPGEPAAGARMLVHPDGAAEGSLGDLPLDGRATEEALDALRLERSAAVDLGDGVGLFLEVLSPPPRLIVCGAGHDAIPLVRAASGLGWQVEVVDDREAFLEHGRFPEAFRFVNGEPRDAARQAGVDDHVYVVVMSHNFLRDKDYLRSFLGSPARYIGMLGPRARLHRILAELRREGFEPDPADLGRVHGPAGLDLGGDGPEEVALAIVGELVAVRNGRKGGFLLNRTGPIHDRPRTEESVGSGAS